MDFGKQNNLNVVSLKSEERTNACNAIIIKEEDGQTFFLLGLRAKHKSGGGQWGLVGGTQCKQETMEETIVRELKEEIGIDVEINDVKWNNFFQCIATENVHFDHHGFVITKWKGEPENLEKDKCDMIKWFSKEELPLDNFFVSKGNIVNFLNNKSYDKQTNFNYKNIK